MKARISLSNILQASVHDWIENRWLLSISLFVFLALIYSSAWSSAWSAASATDLGRTVLRNYPSAMPLTQGRLEIGLDYLLVNATVDILGVKEKEYDKMSSADRATAPGDLQGARLLLNYGLFNGTTLMSDFEYRSQDYGFDAVGIRTLNFSLKQRLLDRSDPGVPKLALDAGIRYDSADDTLYDDQEEINAIMQRISSGSDVRIRIDPTFVWFDRTVDGESFSLGARRQGRPDPQVSIGDLEDFSTYARLTGGWIWGAFFPNLFVEYGHTEISSKVDTTLLAYIPDYMENRLPRFPIDLSRSENYLKVGVSLLIKFSTKALLHLEYDYHKLYREVQLDYMDDNQLLKADLNYFLTPALALHLGGIYFQRQLNGEIPFLYNEFTQTTFDHPYGYVQAGFTYLFK